MARTAAAADALETLVQQFSQPLAFLRELIQNALDAGTNGVEVTVQAADDCFLVEVVDTGEGMTREIIDTQLTRLFSSSKEDDFTKIGKFGVGFVSVFAVEPRAVVVDTGREGESWRVLFRPDRSFERIMLEEPIEGTRVAVYVPPARRKLERFVKECRETVVYWCKHCDVEIRFNGDPIHQPFELGQPHEVRYEEQGTEVVAAPSLDAEPLYGFYNRGLTLLEGRGSPLPGVAFKVRSRYLEHTITRDNVLQDANYRKAMGIVERTAYRALPEKLFENLSSGGARSWELARLVATYPHFRKSRAWSAEILAGAGGKNYSLKQLARGPAPAFADAEDALAVAVGAEGVPVLIVKAQSALALLEAAGISAVPLRESYYLAQLVEPSGDREKRLLGETARLLKAAGLEHLRLASLHLSGPDFSDRLAVFCHDFGRAQPAARAARFTRGHFLALNQEHSLWQDLLPVSHHDLGLAAYLLARGICLACGVDPKEDSGMLSAAFKRRRKLAPAKASSA
ncbi:MAG: ATP-binding protein [Armatimonadetes bacterium]|nr:ATP-binding protein [Armatimonadota bacterium]